MRIREYLRLVDIIFRRKDCYKRCKSFIVKRIETMENSISKCERKKKPEMKRSRNKKKPSVLKKSGSRNKSKEFGTSINRIQKNYSFSKTIKSSVEPKIDFDNLLRSKIRPKLNDRSKSDSQESMLSYSTIQRQFQRYTDILSEVKKIIKKDSISRRNLKYIVRKQHINLPIPNVKLRSSSEDESCTPDDILKPYEDDQDIDFNHLKRLQRILAEKAKASLNKECLSPEASSVEAVANSYKKSIFLTENLISSSFVTKANVKTRIEHTVPSTNYPLTIDEALFNKNITEAARELTLIEEISLPHELSHIDSHKSYNYNNSYKNYLELPNTLLSSRSKHLRQSTNLLANSLLNDKSDDFIYSSKSNIDLKEILSFCELSSNTQSKSHQPCLSSLKIASKFTNWSPFYLIQKDNSNKLLKKKTTFLNTINSGLESKQLLSKRTTRLRKISKSISPNFLNCTKTFCKNCRSRSVSCTKSSTSLSSSNSITSEGKEKKTPSRGSTPTILSSTRYSNSSYSSSRSLSSRSSKSSRSDSSNRSRTRSPSIPRRHGSPSFLHRRRITSARKRPVPYHRPTPSPLTSTCSAENSNYWSDQSCRSNSTLSSQHYLDT